MTRVHFALLLLSFAGFSGCTTASGPALKPVEAHPAFQAPVPAAPAPAPAPKQKIVRFADSLGAVAVSGHDPKLESMIAAFDYCDREQRLAFVTPPLSYSPRVNYSRVSSYSMRLGSDSSSHAFVAPFECIDKKHSVKTGMLESEDVPSFGASESLLSDTKGGVIVHRAAPSSKFAEDDIVVRVGSFRVETRAELVKAVDLSALGDVDFTVIRAGRLVVLPGTVLDTTASMTANALKLLEALCKETGSTSVSCSRHAFKTAQN